MRIGRPNTPQQFVFSLEKVQPSSSSSSAVVPSSSSSEPATSSSSSSLPCQIDPSQQTIQVLSGVTAGGPGMTLAAAIGSKLHFNVLSNYDGLPDQMLLFVSGVQVAMVTFNSPYAGTRFVFERTVGGVTNLYCGNIISGEVNF